MLLIVQKIIILSSSTVKLYTCQWPGVIPQLYSSFRVLTLLSPKLYCGVSGVFPDIYNCNLQLSFPSYVRVTMFAMHIYMCVVFLTFILQLSFHRNEDKTWDKWSASRGGIFLQVEIKKKLNFSVSYVVGRWDQIPDTVRQWRSSLKLLEGKVWMLEIHALVLSLFLRWYATHMYILCYVYY